MALHAHDNALLIHFFQESLIGVALGWYLGLNMDMAPNRSQLQNMAKGERETFKGYAKHWRELAACIQPPLSKKEIATMFIDTLYSLFYEKMVGNVASNFLDLVLIGERIEVGMKTRRIVLKAVISHPYESPDLEEEEEAT
ncbi:hypothetical protein CR513_31304, partial [Mucuna pruriens]